MLMEQLALAFVGISILPLILTETHWMVTENGRIHSVADSLFNMAQPHDLVQFLKQEDRVERSDEAKHRLTSQKSVIRHHEQKDDPQIESRLMQTDPDCILAGKPLAEQDLFLSTVVPLENFGIRLDSRIGNVRKAAVPGVSMPDCTSYALPFSMTTFDHLEGVRDRGNLSSAPEPGLSQIAFDDWINTTDFAYAVSTAIKDQPNDWLLYTLSSYYYRLIGDGAEAIECLRRALHFVPREYAVIPMLSLGNVLHQSGRSKAGSVVMDTAIAYNASLSQVFFTAGHVYAVSLQYEKAYEALDKAAKLDETLLVARQQQAAIRCHQKLESALESQHQNLQKTLTELQSYQVRLKNFQTLHEEMLRLVVDSETRQLTALTYDHVAYGPLDGLFCNTTTSNGQTYIDCDIADFVAYKTAKQDFLDGSGFANVAKKDDESKQESDEKWSKVKGGIASPTANTNEEKRYMETLEASRDLQISTPTRPKKYTAPQRQSSADHFWFEEPMPSDEECGQTSALPRPDAAPFLFLSPENKGFELKRMLTEYLNLDELHGHPLPWYPPFCTRHLQNKPDLHLDCCDHLLGVQRAKVRERERLLAEPYLKQVITSFAHGPANADAEFGQRVLTLMKLNMVTKWLSYNLAALYWRLVGVVAEAAACLRLALAEEDGKRYADVALFQLSYLAYNAGSRVDDAINLLHQAVELDDNEPAVHSLLCYYLIVKENFTGAAFHLRKALDLEPNLKDGIDLMKTLKCKLKGSASDPTKSGLERPPLSKCSDMAKGPKFFCLREGGEERCYLEERMLPGAAAGQDDMIMCPACNMPHCLKPPPLASMFISMVDKSTKPTQESKAKGKRGLTRPVVQPTSPLTQLDQEEVETEMSLIDASMQPGSMSNVKEAIVEREALPNDKSSDKATTEPTDVESENENVPNSGNRPILLEHLRSTPAARESDDGPVPVSPPTTNEKWNVAQFTELDSPLPDILPVPSMDMVRAAQASLDILPSTAVECMFWKGRVKVEQPISTYLSVSAKGINAQSYIDFSSPVPKKQLEPVCLSDMPSTMWTMDHLHGYIFRHNLSHYKPESGLKDAFQKLGGTKESIESVASRVAHALISLKDAGDSQQMWVLTTIAALYWRIQGNASMAINCLRHAVSQAPYPMKDLALVSLANVYHQSGFLHSALIAAGSALNVSPRFVVVHFTLANIYAALGDWERAMVFYYSTLSLQGNLEAAKDRIRAIYCASGAVSNEIVQVRPAA